RVIPRIESVVGVFEWIRSGCWNSRLRGNRIRRSSNRRRKRAGRRTLVAAGNDEYRCNKKDAFHRDCAVTETGLFTAGSAGVDARSEEHTSELQSHLNLVCRLLLEKKKALEGIWIFG